MYLSTTVISSACIEILQATYIMNKSLALLMKLHASSYSPTAFSINPMLICNYMLISVIAAHRVSAMESAVTILTRPGTVGLLRQCWQHPGGSHQMSTAAGSEPCRALAGHC